MGRTPRTGHEKSLKECIEMNISVKRGDLEMELIKHKEAAEIIRTRDLEKDNASYTVYLRLAHGECGASGYLHFGTLKDAIENAYHCFRQMDPRRKIETEDVWVDIKIGELDISISQFHWEDYFYSIKESAPKEPTSST